METITLLDAARNLEVDAISAIFKEYSTPIYRYALRLCQDPIRADHIVGDVFAKFIDQLAEGKGPQSNLKSYLYQTAYHLIVDQSQKAKFVSPIEIIGLSLSDDSRVDIDVEKRILLDSLLIAMNNELTEDQRHVIVLRFLEGFNINETAEILGKHPSNVKVLQHRGILALRQALKAKAER